MKTSLFVTVLALFLAATTQSSAQSAKAGEIITAFYKAVDAGNLAAVEQMSTPDFMAQVPVSPQPFDLPVWKQFLTGFKTGFPDMHHEILDWVSDGKKLAVRGVFTGTNTGSMQGNPPTGNKVSLPFNSFFELDKDLKVKSVYVQFDQVAFQQQLMAGLPDPKAMAETNIRGLFAAMDAGAVDQFSNFCSADFRIYHPLLSGPAPLGAFQGIIQGQKAGFPDLRHEITDFYTDGKKATVRGIFHGTNTGSMQGNPPTGNRVDLPFIVSYDLDAQGKILNQYVSFDADSFGKQLMAGLSGK